MVIGAIVAFYGEKQEPQNQLLLIAGIVLLMIGMYRIARRIPSKKDSEDNSEIDN